MPKNFECCHQCSQPKRQVGCHIHCEAYRQAKEVRDKIRESEQRQRDNSYLQISTTKYK